MIGEHLSEAGVGLVPHSDRAEDTPVATATIDEQGQARTAEAKVAVLSA